MSIHSNTTHRRLWLIWAIITGLGFTILESISLLDRDPDNEDPSADTLTHQINTLIKKYPPLWFILGGFLEWFRHHFLARTVPWTDPAPFTIRTQK